MGIMPPYAANSREGQNCSTITFLPAELVLSRVRVDRHVVLLGDLAEGAHKVELIEVAVVVTMADLSTPPLWHNTTAEEVEFDCHLVSPLVTVETDQLAIGI